MSENIEQVAHLLGVKVVDPGTTYNGGDCNVAVINNRKYPVRVTMWELRPPPPPPPCWAQLQDDEDEHARVTCECVKGHYGLHRQTIDGTKVFWDNNHG